MFRGLGAPWSLGLLAFVCLFCAPIPFLFIRYGARIRSSSPYSVAAPPPGNVDDAALEAGSVNDDEFWRPSQTAPFPTVERKNRPSMVSPFPTWPKEAKGAEKEIWFDARADPW